MTLGQNIAQLRAQKGLSQGELADMLDISRQSVSKWETDASIPELDKLLRLSGLFGVTLDELVKGTETTQRSENAERIAEAESAPLPAAPRWGTRQIIGTILLCFGALIGLLFAMLGGTLAGFLPVLPLLVCGAVCLTVRRRTGLWCAWVLYAFIELYLRFATGLSWATILLTFRWTAEMNYLRLAIAWGQTACLFAMLLCTLRSYRTLMLSGGRKQLAYFAVLWIAFLMVSCVQSVWLRWIRENYAFSLESAYYVAHHVLDLMRIGLFAAILVFAAAFIRGRKRAGNTKAE